MANNSLAARVETKYGQSVLGELRRELAVSEEVFAEMTIREVAAALERTVWCAIHKGHRVPDKCNACRIFAAQGA